MKKAEIALVTLDYPPERGGVARYLGNLVLASNGAIDVFVPEAHQTSGPGHVEQARLLNTSPAPPQRGGVFTWMPWRPAISFIRSLKKKGYDRVLVSHALPFGTAAWIARMTGGPEYSVLFHGLDLRLALGSKRKSWILRRVLRKAKSVIANSEFTAKEIRTFEPTVHPVAITPGVESMPLPDRILARRELKVRNDEFIILSVARLVPRKGIDQLIAALIRLPANTRLVVVGDGEDRRRLEALTALVEDRVTFVPHATDEERNAWYAAADVFALPVRETADDVEGFGIVFLEASLAGLPIVAGKSGGVAEAVVDGETGLSVDPTDVDAIADVLNRLIHDQSLRQTLGLRGKARAEKEFQWKDRWNLFENILKFEH